MDEQEFIRIADACLARVADWLEELDPDEVDYSTGDGAVTIEFPDGMKFILSRQPPARQMWLAAGAHGWHFDYDPATEAWIDDKDGGDLFERIAEAIADQIGHPVEFDG
jgi:iron-sulfur cluster assembly protein CyaY